MRCFVLGLALFAMTAAPPHAARADDREIAEQIVSRLQAEKEKGNLQGFNIDLEINEGVVYLSGHVSESSQERLAIDVARRIDGVKRVFNGLDVTGRDEETAPQNSLRRQKSDQPQVAKELSTPAPFPLAQAINKESDKEAIDLQIAQAHAEIPANEPGISSREIAEHIIGELRDAKKQGDLKGFSIDVEVRRGEVWLKGQVSNSKQEELAVEIARRTRGVKQVINALSIENEGNDIAAATPNNVAGSGLQRASEQEHLKPAIQAPAASPSDAVDSDGIAREVLSRLQEQQRQGSLRNFGIDVQVDGRTVWLSGYVSSKAQEQLVLDVARYTPGVGQVVNDLTITDAGNQSASATTETVLGTPVGQLASTSAASIPETSTPAPASAAAPPAQAWAPYGYQPVAGYGAMPAAVPPRHQTPLAFAPASAASHNQLASVGGQPSPISMGAGSGFGMSPARFDHPQMPGYAWPSYAAYPNYAGVTYPQQYSASAWPYIGPFYPYPQVPLGWRRVTLEWDDGWWHLKFKNKCLH